MLHHRALLLTLAILRTAAVAAETPPDPGLARAIQLEQSGDHRQASDAYRAWLDAHSVPKDPGTADLYVQALIRLARVEPEVRLVQHFLEAAPLASLSPTGRLTIHVALAELLDTLGEVEKAQAAYERAAAVETTDLAVAARYQLRSAALLYELGQPQNAEARVLEVLDGARGRAGGETIASALYLLGRIQAATDRPDDALGSWGRVVTEHADAVWAPAACFGIYTLARGLGRDDVANAALARLKDGYPDSPEREIADATFPRRMTLAPRPSVLLEPYLANLAPDPVVAAEPAPISAPQVAPARVSPAAETPGNTALVVVLAGSYTSKDNAERHRREIESRGFPSRVAQIEVNGVSYYRVLVGDASTRDAAITLSQKLKDRDLESTLLVVQARTGG